MVYIPESLHIRIFDYICSPKWKCGEIWLLATTQKNAKMLTVMVILPDDRFHINVFVFCDRSAFLWGFFLI